LSSIVHNDNTARVQTITREQNTFIYDLLTQIEEAGSIPVLLNTSFNVNGKPILNSYRDAFHMLVNSGLDHMVIINEYTEQNGIQFTTKPEFKIKKN
jgi:carbamoyltransferase